MKTTTTVSLRSLLDTQTSMCPDIFSGFSADAQGFIFSPQSRHRRSSLCFDLAILCIYLLVLQISYFREYTPIAHMTVLNVCKSNTFYLTSAASDESSSSRSQKNHSRPWKLLQHLIVSADSFSSFVFYLVVFRLNDSLTLGGKKKALHISLLFDHNILKSRSKKQRNTIRFCLIISEGGFKKHPFCNTKKRDSQKNDLLTRASIASSCVTSDFYYRWKSDATPEKCSQTRSCFQVLFLPRSRTLS